MKTAEYRTIDKSGWERGEWDGEPDKKQWQDEKTGLPCLIVRGAYGGALCGYVGVKEGHPAFKKEYSEVDGIEVHGGLTFSGHCRESGDEEEGICHKSDDPAPVWWLGFDCAHCWDVSPGRDSFFEDHFSSYRDF